jgi:peptidoglycan hydrolase CwlO-like protein
MTIPTNKGSTSAADLPKLRKDYERQQADVIRFQTQLESVDNQLKELKDKAKTELSVSSLEELRNLTKSEMKDQSQKIESFRKTLERRSTIIDHVKESLAGLDQ